MTDEPQDAPLFRAWRAEQIVARATFPEAGYRPAVHDFDAYDYLWTPYDILGSGTQLGWPICQVFFHGRSQTWCCGCPAGVRGPLPCRHIAGVLWWVELDRLRRGYDELEQCDLLAVWAAEARRVRALRAGWEPLPRNWRIAPSALFDALCRRGLATAVPGAEAIWELVEQCPALVAA